MGWLLIAAAGTLVLLVASPVSLAVRVEREAALRAAWRVEWLYGIVRVRGSVPSSRRRRRRLKPRPARAKRTGRGRKQALLFVRSPGLGPRALRLAADMWRRLSWDDLALHVEYGLDDPADTGRLHGALAPLLVAASVQGYDVRCVPRYLEPGLAGWARASVRVRPAALAALLIGFLCSPPVLRAAGAAWRSNR